MKAKRIPLEEAGNLRLPVPFFDLFMVLLICFMMFLTPVPSGSVDTRNIDIPLSRKGGEVDAGKLLPAAPHRQGQTWIYELTEDGRRLTAGQLAEAAKAKGRKVILIVPAKVSLQEFVEIQGNLRDHQVEFGLAVKEEGKQ